MIDEMRVCPFDGQLVVCDSDCDNCDWVEDEDDVDFDYNAEVE